MYRTYENPRTLEDLLDEARNNLKDATAEDNEDAIMYAALEVAELEERVNFAWQDDEHDEEV